MFGNVRWKFHYGTLLYVYPENLLRFKKKINFYQLVTEKRGDFDHLVVF